MSGVRVLVGTRKGAFVLTSDGKRKKWKVSGPHFAGWEIYHLKGSPADPEPDLRLAVERLVRPDDAALERRRQDLGSGGQRVRLRRRARHPPVVRRHAASLGVQAGVAPGAVARRSGHRLRRRRGRRPLPQHRRRQDVAGAVRPPQARLGAELDARRRRHVSPHHHPGRRPTRSGCSSPSRRPGAFRTDDGGDHLAADQPRPALPVHPRPGRRGRPLRPPDRACTAPGPTRCSCRSTGT